MQLKFSSTFKVFVLLLLSVRCEAQKFEWVNFFQGQGTQYPVGMTVDQKGNQYATFNFHNEIKVDTLSVKYSGSNQKGFVTKQNTNGKVLWHRTIDAMTSGSQAVYTIASMFNSKGNLIVFTACLSNIKLGKDTIKRKGTTGYALYLIELNDSGKIVNANHLIEGNLINLSFVSNRILCDKNDNLYIGLTYTGQVKVYDSVGTNNLGTTSSGSRHLICKFSNSGNNFKWSSSLPYADFVLNSLKVDIHENVYVATYWAGSSITFNGKSVKNPQTVTGTILIWDKNGKDKNWFYIEASGQKGAILDIAVHDSNSVFISGTYVGDSARFDTILKKNKHFGAYLFFARYNAKGNVKWVKVEDTSYSTSLYGFNYFSSMTNYKDAYFYLSYFLPFHYTEPVSFDGQKYAPDPMGYGFNMKGDERGNILWGFRSFYPFFSMGTDAQNNFYFQGTWVNDTIKFGNFKAFPSVYDAFIGKTFDYAIYRGNIYAGPYCAGDSFYVPYTVRGSFSDSNIFFAEISDEFGNFTGNEREIGRLKTKDSGTIKGLLPMFRVASSGKYRIRIRSTSPQAQSFYKEDSLRLLIYSRDKANPGPPEHLCYGDTIKLNTYGGTKWTWSPKYNMTDSNLRQPLAWPIVNTTYKIIIDDSSGCGAPDTAYKDIILRDPLKLSIAFNDTIVCDTSVLKLPMHFEGGDTLNYHWQAYSVVSPNSWQAVKSGKLKPNDTLFHVPKISITTSQKLAIVLDDQCTNKKDTAFLTITLLKPSIINAKFNDTILCVGNTIKWKAKSLYILNKYQWEWKDITNNKVISTNDSLSLTAGITTKIRLTLSNGCTIDSSIFTLNVNPPLKVSVMSGNGALNDTTLCFGQSLKLNSSGKGGDTMGYNYKWYLNNTLLSSTNNLIINTASNFVATGEKKTLKLVLNDHCTLHEDSLFRTIESLPAPQAAFTFGVACDLSDTKFTFTGTKPQSPVTTSFNWNFNKQGTSSLENPSFLFNTTGTKNITVYLTSSNGCKDSISKSVDVKPQAKADFNFSKLCEWDTVSFMNKSSISSGILSYKWTLGDGGNTNSESPKHLYAIGGISKTFDVKLVAVISGGCSDSISKSITVIPAPKADFSYGSVCDLSDTKFTFTGIKPSAPLTTAFLWSFSANDSSTLENPSYHFVSAGTSRINLRVTSSNGCTDKISKDVIVKPQSKADFEVKDVCEDSSAVFINKSGVSSGTLNYSWKFGDGQKSSLKSPRHLYNIGGVSTTFNVSLVAIVTDGCSDSIIKAVTVNANPKGTFTYTVSGKQVIFKADQSGATMYKWNFGDGGMDSTTNNTYTYNYNKFPSGKYNACLKVSNASGCSAESCKEISINNVSVVNIDKQAGIKIFPNPNDGKFNVIINEPKENLSIIIYNYLGEKIKPIQNRPGQTNYPIELNVSKGVYLITIINGESMIREKVIVTK